jgi:DNA-directed RNA polymerase subunit RPC12/RpoP
LDLHTININNWIIFLEVDKLTLKSKEYRCLNCKQEILIYLNSNNQGTTINCPYCGDRMKEGVE